MGTSDLQKVLKKIRWEKYLWTELDMTCGEDQLCRGAIDALEILEKYVIDMVEVNNDKENPVG